jgi:hypothetical protein
MRAKARTSVELVGLRVAGHGQFAFVIHGIAGGPAGFAGNTFFVAHPPNIRPGIAEDHCIRLKSTDQCPCRWPIVVYVFLDGAHLARPAVIAQAAIGSVEPNFEYGAIEGQQLRQLCTVGSYVRRRSVRSVVAVPRGNIDSEVQAVACRRFGYLPDHIAFAILPRAANLTYDGAEGRLKALQASGLYERRAYLTEVYRNALAQEVRGLGYDIEQRRDSRGRDLGFEIRGVSDELLERYSQRSAQRDAAIEEFKEQHGRKPTDNEVAVLVRESCADKLTEIATEQVRQQQQARLSPDESHCLDVFSVEHRRHVRRGCVPEAVNRCASSFFASVSYMR